MIHSTPHHEPASASRALSGANLVALPVRGRTKYERNALAFLSRAYRSATTTNNGGRAAADRAVAGLLKLAGKVDAARAAFGLPPVAPWSQTERAVLSAIFGNGNWISGKTYRSRVSQRTVAGTAGITDRAVRFALDGRPEAGRPGLCAGAWWVVKSETVYDHDSYSLKRSYDLSFDRLVELEGALLAEAAKAVPGVGLAFVLARGVWTPTLRESGSGLSVNPDGASVSTFSSNDLREGMRNNVPEACGTTFRNIRDLPYGGSSSCTEGIQQTEGTSSVVGNEEDRTGQESEEEATGTPTDSPHSAPEESAAGSATLKADSSDTERPPLVPGIPPTAPGDLAGDVVTPEQAREILGAEIDGFRTLAYLSRPEIAERLANASLWHGPDAVREVLRQYAAGEEFPGKLRGQGVGLVRFMTTLLESESGEVFVRQVAKEHAAWERRQRAGA